MKKIFILILSFILIACGNKDVDEEKIDFETRDGVFYKIGTDELYNGVIVVKNDTNGNIQQKFTVENGKKEGEITIYHDNKRNYIKEKAQFKKNVLEGEYKLYDENGNIVSNPKTEDASYNYGEGATVASDDRYIVVLENSKTDEYLYSYIRNVNSWKNMVDPGDVFN